MRNKLVFLSLLIFGYLGTEAQIAQQYTMYNQNHYLINPASAGNKDFADVAMGYRRQWSGFSDAPSSFYATGHTTLNRPKVYQRSALHTSNSSSVDAVRLNQKRASLKHAIGAQLMSNSNGAFGKDELVLTYALHLPITKSVQLAFGVSSAFSNFSFDETKVKVLDANDQTYDAFANGASVNKFNANAGTYLYSNKFFFGYSVANLVQHDLDIATSNSAASVELQHNILGGYNFPITNSFELKPSALIKLPKSQPLSYDINLTLDYKQTMFTGISYRSEDAISLQLGMQASPLLRFGYAYDYNTSEIKEQSGGSHELFIGLTIY